MKTIIKKDIGLFSEIKGACLRVLEKWGGGGGGLCLIHPSLYRISTSNIKYIKSMPANVLLNDHIKLEL